MSTTTSRLRASAGQRGFSLFIVLIMLLLSALLAVGGARMAQLLESMAGNQREYQRAFEAAEAALLDAERDIRQLAFDATTQTYVKCSALAASPCRKAGDGRVFPDRDTGWVTAYVGQGANSCGQGICYFAGIDSVSAASGSEAYKFWTRAAYSNLHAAYGQFTGAPDAGSPALASARYWIEVIDRPRSGEPLYRITALSTGARTASTAGGTTRVVLQVSFDPDAVRKVN
ncbi:PilX N-terminal domain-containing pilus assembly protein [Variovorax sp. Root411]|uniref:pilus assembly PilX family protein n=1 Tax=Variovorax sp. Root411 TaxID=1736530 RepID=UPI0006FCC5C6|nr:PilX N-terminal domain-containing pilus assembly protein [Variovorax sp. Root411]KQW57617.1 pilus assembly protein PilX [Variovorax sp. Root411]